MKWTILLAALSYQFSIASDFTSSGGNVSTAALAKELQTAVGQQVKTLTVEEDADTVTVDYYVTLPGGQEAAQTTAINDHLGTHKKKLQKNCVLLVRGTEAMAAGGTYTTIGDVWVGSPDSFVDDLPNTTVELEGILNTTGTGAGCRLVEADQLGGSAVVLKTKSAPDTSSADQFFNVDAGSAVRAGRWQYALQCRLNGASAGSLTNTSACLVQTLNLP